MKETNKLDKFQSDAAISTNTLEKEKKKETLWNIRNLSRKERELTQEFEGIGLDIAISERRKNLIIDIF